MPSACGFRWMPSHRPSAVGTLPNASPMGDIGATESLADEDTPQCWRVALAGVARSPQQNRDDGENAATNDLQTNSYCLEADFIEQIDHVRVALLDESDSLGELGMIGEEGLQAVALLRPIGPHWRAGIARSSSGPFFRLFLLPVFFAFRVDLRERIGEMNQEVVILARVAQHLEGFAFRVAVLAIAREDIMIGHHPFEEASFHIPIAAMMRHL